MGISIHYSGRIADKQKLPQLIEEVQEIANVHGWKYTVYQREFPTPVVNSETLHHAVDETHNGLLYGIDFTPEDSETIAFCFLSNGKMSSIMQLASWGNFEKESVILTESEEWDENDNHSSSSDETILDQSEYNRLLCMCFAKIQFAGPRTHEMIIAIFRYISTNYLADFKLTDEGEFWETGDSALLQENFKRNGFLIDSFTDRIINEQRLPGEDTEHFIKRIAGDVRKKKENE